MREKEEASTLSCSFTSSKNAISVNIYLDSIHEVVKCDIVKLKNLLKLFRGIGEKLNIGFLHIGTRNYESIIILWTEGSIIGIRWSVIEWTGSTITEFWLP